MVQCYSRRPARHDFCNGRFGGFGYLRVGCKAVSDWSTSCFAGSRSGAVSALALVAVVCMSAAAPTTLAQSNAGAAGAAPSPRIAESLGSGGGIPVTNAERVSIKVPEFPALSGEYRINDDDTISFPVVGRIKVTGKTPVELERVIAEEVRRRAGRECQDPECRAGGCG